jgi:hypothetical protein
MSRHRPAPFHGSQTLRALLTGLLTDAAVRVEAATVILKRHAAEFDAIRLPVHRTRDGNPLGCAELLVLCDAFSYRRGLRATQLSVDGNGRAVNPLLELDELKAAAGFREPARSRAPAVALQERLASATVASLTSVAPCQ